MSVDELRPVVYREIEGFPGYRVGNDGTVWTCWSKIGLGWRYGTQSVMSGEWRELQGGLDKDGYRKVILCNASRRRTARIAALVLETFCSPRPKGYTSAHNNGIKTDNRLENLSWKTQKENIADKKRHGTHQAGEKHPCAILSDEDVRNVRRLRKLGLKYREISDQTGIKIPSLCAICTGKQWAHVQDWSNG